MTYINTYHSTHEWNNIVKKITTCEISNIDLRWSPLPTISITVDHQDVKLLGVKWLYLPYLYIHYLYYISDMRLIWKRGMLYNFYLLFMEFGLIFSKLRIYWYMCYLYIPYNYDFSYLTGSSLIHLQFIQLVFNWVHPQN